MGDLLLLAYPYVKSLHLMAVIAWMAGLFYMPRLFVYHVERGPIGSEMSETFKVMELKLLKVIINPAGITVWLMGILLAVTPGVIDWTEIWVWFKLVGIVGMTWFHHKLVTWRKVFAADANDKPGRYYRMMNEVPTLFMVIIVGMVIIRPF